MSTTTKWVIAVIVIAVAAWFLWRGGSTGQPSVQQSAAAGSAVAANEAIAQNTAAVDGYLNANVADLVALGKALSLSTEATVASRLGAAASLMTSVTSQLQTNITNAKTAGKSVDALQAAYNDMNTQISTATSIIVAASKEISALKPAAGTANNPVLQRSLPRLQSAQTYLQTARADIKKIVDGLK